MFKKKKIEYFRIQKGSPDKLMIKYKGEKEQFLTSGKVDLKEFEKHQKKFK